MNNINQDLDALEDARGRLFQHSKRPSSWQAISAKINPKISRPGSVILRTLLFHSTSPLTITKLANMLCVEAPSISREVKQLEAIGLIKRGDSGGDKRTAYLKPTTKAEKLNSQLNLARRSVSKAVLEKWDESDRRIFVKLFTRYVLGITGEQT